MFNRFAALGLLLIAMPAMQGCALVVAGGAAGATMVAMDARDVGTQVDDNNLRLRIQTALQEQSELAEQRVLIVTYNSNVLAYGQVSSNGMREQAVRLIRNTQGVNRVYDQLRVAEPVSFTQRSRDTLLTSRVKTTLIAQRQFDHSNIRVFTEASEVFLVGRTSREAAANAIEVTRHINGVERVIDVIERD
ncbi:MAG: BON domain-containing protein [Idiomarina sp.]|nr:BON domain-containing protein [Idiomarina sp.]MCL5050560.1 BON domain-containing protein [Bacillota bacterium]